MLVDTSVWIKFFRAPHSLEAQVLDVLLSAGPVATCAPIRAEVVSGAQTRREFDRLRELFDGLIDLEPPDDLWPRIEERRFELAKRGEATSLIDLTIVLTAHAHHAALWTLDRDFSRMTTVIPVTTFHPS